MNRSEIEAILNEHLRGTHEELGALFRSIEVNLDNHLANTEAVMAVALSRGATLLRRGSRKS